MIRGCGTATAAVLIAIVALGAIAVAADDGSSSDGFVKPVTGAQLTQGFGCTRFAFEPVDRACPGGHWHSGIDLAAPLGTPVYATAPGRVAVHVSNGGYGTAVVLDHGGGLSSLYGHLSGVLLVGDATDVDAGDVIGTVGSTGNSTGPHLHFEIRRDGIAEDPQSDLSLP